MERSRGLTSGGAKAAISSGIRILQLPRCRSMVTGMSCAMMAASLSGFAWLGRGGATVCSCRSRTGSNCGSFCTFSSDRRRFRPGSRTNNQASETSPVIQLSRSQKCFGRVSRLSAGRGEWSTCGLRGMPLFNLGSFPHDTVTILSCIYNNIDIFLLTFPHVMAQHTSGWVGSAGYPIYSGASG
jgi:hypothetical protein